MRKMVDAILRQYGTEVTIRRDNVDQTVRCFFQPVNSTSWQSIESEATPLGEYSRGQYAYIGPAGTAVREGDTIRLGEKEYLFRRVEPYWYGNQQVYLWGLCVEKGVNDTWGTQS